MFPVRHVGPTPRAAKFCHKQSHRSHRLMSAPRNRCLTSLPISGDLHVVAIHERSLNLGKEVWLLCHPSLQTSLYVAFHIF